MLVLTFAAVGGPGSGKGTQSQRLVERFPGVVHLSMGDILRKEIAEQGSTSDKISMLCDLIYEGDMAPTVSSVSVVVCVVV